MYLPAPPPHVFSLQCLSNAVPLAIDQDKKKTSSAGSAGPASTQPAPVPHSKPKSKAATAAPTPKEQKKRAGLKDKAKASARRRDDDSGPVLGGADYVELMLGGRRKAAAEAAKLPKDPDSL